MSETHEIIIGTVKAFCTSKHGSKVVTILKEVRERLGEENTKHFIQKLDSRGRIILEPIK